MAQELESKIVLTGVDKTTAMWLGATKHLREFGAQAQRVSGALWLGATKHLREFGAQAQRVSGAFGLPKVSRALTDVGRAASNVGRALAPLARGLATLTGITAAGGITAFALALRKSADSIDDLSKAARQLGVPLQTLREMTHVAKLQGVEFEQLYGGLVKASKGYSEVRLGVGRMAKQLEKISPQLAAQLKAAKSSGEAFDIMFGAIHNARDEATKIKLSELFFGNADFTKIAELSSAEVNKLRENFRRLGGEVSTGAGQAIEDYNDSLTDLAASFSGISDAIAVKVLPQLTPLIKSFTDLVATNRDLIALKVGEWFEGVATWVKSVNWQQLGHDLAVFATNVAHVVDAIGGWKTVIYAAVAAPFLPLAVAVGQLAVAVGRLGLALATTPAGAMLALAAVAGYAAWNKWDDITAKLKNAGEAAAAAGAAFRNADFSGFSAGAWKAVHEGLDAFLTWDREVAKTLQLEWLFDWQVDLEKRMFTAGYDAIVAFANGIRKAYMLPIEAVQGIASAISNALGVTGKPVPPDAGHRTPLRRSTPSGRASGGPVVPGGWNIVGENGPELVNWTHHGMVTNAETTKALASPYTADRAGRAFAKALAPSFNRLTASLEDLKRTIAKSDIRAGGGDGGSGGYGSGYGGGNAASGHRRPGTGGSHPASGGRPGDYNSDTGNGLAAYKGQTGEFSGAPNARAASWMAFGMGELGLNKGQAAGMVAGLMGESGRGLNPAAVGDGGTSGGTAQWHNERWARLKQFAAAQRKQWTDVGIQQQYLKRELANSERAAYAGLKAAKTPQQALNAWVQKFERPADPYGESRRRAANLPALMKGDFKPLIKEQPSAAQTVNIGKGEMKIAVKVHGPGSIAGISNRSPENLTTSVGADRTGKRYWHAGP